ncbi:preprotein translocase subunit SecY [Mycoplasmopsis opalescens]|uniref:preprotein translocase subunit SecY n=1 Tax=Mycoplasmopsis opalescens TaxID=114886 RepID=UPI000568F2C9|nr:preprotein translocase subunit SecY [Mycoplasmopsis opalescens]
MKNKSNKISLFFSRWWYSFRNGWNNFWSSKDLLKKTLFTLLLLAIYVTATTIKSPFIKIANNTLIDEDSFLSTLNLIGGGGLRSFSLVALGISPFINASLIMSVLQSRIFPPFYKLTQSGPLGRRKLNIITRILTLIIAFPQAILLSQSLASGDNPFISIVPAYADAEGSKAWLNTTKFFFLPMILVAGSLFSLFIAETVTNKGVGNGTSLIIFIGIAFSLPSQFKNAISYFISDTNSSELFIGIIKFLAYLFSFLALIFIVALVYNSERHVPIQQTGVGRSRNIHEMGRLPIKLNPGGIMPIIFASMVVSFPIMIVRLIPDGNLGKAWVNENLQFTKPLGLSLMVVITFFFSFLFGIQQSKLDRISEDFAKNSTFIPGLQPGEQTEDYLFGIIIRLSAFSGIYLVILSIVQYLQIILLAWPQVISFGGTSIMIFVSVALETIQQYQARRKTTRLSRQKQLSLQVSEQIKRNKEAYATGKKVKENNNSGEGLLW